MKMHGVEIRFGDPIPFAVESSYAAEESCMTEKE